MYLVSTEPFRLITGHHALNEAFRKQDIHRRLARWVDFLSDYEFEIAYRPGEKSKPADFLSRYSMGGAATNGDEWYLLLTIGTSKQFLDGLEPNIQEVVRHLSGAPMKSEDKNARNNIRRGAKNFLMWDDNLFRRTQRGLQVVAPIYERVKILRCLHDEIDHWDRTGTMRIVTDRFWWPSVRKDVERYVRTYDPCQRRNPLPPYASNFSPHFTGLFEVFYIDFAGPFPRPYSDGPSHLVVYVEHFTGWPIVQATRM